MDEWTPNFNWVTLSGLLSEFSIYIFFATASYRLKTSAHYRALKQNVCIISIPSDIVSPYIFKHRIDGLPENFSSSGSTVRLF